jgi:hypothetical protein
MKAAILIASMGVASAVGLSPVDARTEATASKSSRVYLRSVEVKDLSDPEPGKEDELFLVVYRYTGKEAKARRITGGNDAGYAVEVNTRKDLDFDVQVAEAELEPGQFVEYLVCAYEDDDNIVSQLTEVAPWLGSPVERGHEVLLEKIGIQPSKLRGGVALHGPASSMSDPQTQFLQDMHEVYGAISKAASSAAGERAQFLGSFVFRLAREGQDGAIDHLVLELGDLAATSAKGESLKCANAGDKKSDCQRPVGTRVTFTGSGSQTILTLGLSDADRTHGSTP